MLKMKFQAQDEDTVITMYESGKVMFQGTSADVDALEKLCESLGVTGEMLQAVTSLKSAMGAVEAGAPMQAFQSQIDEAKAKITELSSGQYELDFNFDGNSVPSNTGSDKGKKDSSSAKTFNWVEILLDKLSKKTDELKEKFEEAFSLTKAKTVFKKAIKYAV